MTGRDRPRAMAYHLDSSLAHYYMPVYVPVYMPDEDYSDGTEPLRLFMSVYHKNADRSPINRRYIAGRSTPQIAPSPEEARGGWKRLEEAGRGQHNHAQIAPSRPIQQLSPLLLELLGVKRGTGGRHRGPHDRLRSRIFALLLELLSRPSDSQHFSASRGRQL